MQVNWSEQWQVYLMYVLCDDQNYYFGGTCLGKKYVTKHPDIVEGFLCSVNIGML